MVLSSCIHKVPQKLQEVQDEDTSIHECRSEVSHSFLKSGFDVVFSKVKLCSLTLC